VNLTVSVIRQEIRLYQRRKPPGDFVQILYNRIGNVAFLVLLAILKINNLCAINVVSCTDRD
jgi:hypothetical protein